MSTRDFARGMEKMYAREQQAHKYTTQIMQIVHRQGRAEASTRPRHLALSAT
jgi:ATP-dependent Clp protease adapter protein ClpS